MTDSPPAAPPAPRRDVPGRRPAPAQAPQAECRAAVVHAAARGDWPATLARARALAPDDAAAGPAVNAAVLAALMLKDPGEIAFAAGLALEADLSPQLRTTLAWRFARAGHGTQALAVLLADPASFGAAAAMEPTQRVMVARTLSLLAADRALDPTLRAAARRHAGRFFGARPIESAPASERAFAPPGPPPALRGAPPRIHLAPATPAPFVQEAEQAMALFGQAAAVARPPQLRVLEDVYVNRQGQIWRHAGQLMPGQLADIPPASVAAMDGAPRLAEAVLAIEPNENVYHWFAEWLPSLAWRLNDAACALPLLVGDSAPGYVAQSLDLAQAAPAPRVAVGDACFVGRLYVASRETVRLANHASYGDLFARIVARAEAAAPAAAAPAPMYLSRRDSPKRVMDNEEALCRALEARGIETVVMSRLSFAAQIARIRRAPLVVAAHGAGLAHLLTARPGTRVLEIVPVLPGSLMLRCCFAKLSWLFGHDHHLWLENANPVTGRWAADLPGVMALLDRLEPVRSAG